MNTPRFKSMFEKKYAYNIITDIDTNRRVQDFAKEHSIDKATYTMRVYGCLFEGDNLVQIRFNSKEHPAMVYCDIINEFCKDCDVAIRRSTIFVYKKD